MMGRVKEGSGLLLTVVYIHMVTTIDIDFDFDLNKVEALVTSLDRCAPLHLRLPVE
jgi:hypothetical protein